MLETIDIASSQLHTFKGAQHDDAILVLPYIDKELTMRLREVLERRANHPGLLLLVDDDERMGFMKIANIMCSRTQSRYFGYLAQDAFPSMGWLDSAIKTLDGTNAGMLAFNDGRFHGTLAVFGLARRTWLEGLYRKFIFYPGYHSHFGDTELSSIAASQHQLVYNPACIMMEVDYEKHTRKNNQDDALLYKEREQTAFGGLAR